ncbi:hypothetical protein YC2023_111226 [Brassica napus]
MGSIQSDCLHGHLNLKARNYNYSLEVGDSHDGLIIQRNMALFFSGGDRKELKLPVTGRIWKEQQQSGGACIPNLS